MVVLGTLATAKRVMLSRRYWPVRLLSPSPKFFARWD